MRAISRRKPGRVERSLISCRKYRPDDLVRRATGAPMRMEPYLAYLRGKYGELYALPAQKRRLSGAPRGLRITCPYFCMDSTSSGKVKRDKRQTRSFCYWPCPRLIRRQYQRLIYLIHQWAQHTHLKPHGDEPCMHNTIRSPIMDRIIGRIQFQRSLQWLLAMACLLIGGTQATAMTKECARRDAQVLMRIEAHESMGRMQMDDMRMGEMRMGDMRISDKQEAVDALFALMQARHLCHEGKVREALALYDGIVPGSAMEGRPGAAPALTGRRQ